MKNADVDLWCWEEGVESKLSGKGKKWGREEFDKLTGRCDVCLMLPEHCVKQADGEEIGCYGRALHPVCGGDDCCVSGGEGHSDGAASER